MKPRKFVFLTGSIFIIFIGALLATRTGAYVSCAYPSGGCIGFTSTPIVINVFGSLIILVGIAAITLAFRTHDQRKQTDNLHR